MKETRKPEEITNEQLKRVENVTYTVQKLDEQDYLTQANQVTDNRHENYLGRNVRDAVIKSLGEKKYEAFDNLNIKKAPDDEVEDIQLHHSVGSRLALNGQDVLEFNIAGTNFMNYRMPHKGISRPGSKQDFKAEKKIHWYNKNRFLTWIRLAKPASKIEKENEKIRKRNRQVLNTFGEKYDVKVKGKSLNHLRKKESVNSAGATKTRFYMRGPNILNVGKYSEDELEEYILELGKQTLNSKLELMDLMNDEELKYAKHINIILQGHSRGAVASGLGAMRIKRWIYDTYPRLIDLVHFHLIQYDPVAGGPENFGYNSKIDHDPLKKSDATRDSRYMSLGKDANTTVFYSMHTQYNKGFTPQFVNGAKRIILSMADHGANLAKTDDTQEKSSRVTYLAEKDGKVQAFRSTGLNELDEGIFLADDRNNLIKINNMEEYDRVSKLLLKGVTTQDARHQVVRGAVEEWFLRKANQQVPVPKELMSVLKEKQALQKLPTRTINDMKVYVKKRSDFYKSKKEGMLEYVDRLYKQKEGNIDKTKKDFLHELIELSYQVEKDMGGFHTDARAKRISKLKNRIRTNPMINEFDSFTPEYLKINLYVGTQSKLQHILK